MNGEQLRLVDDTQGKINEVLINYTPFAFELIEQLIGVLPETKFYICHGYTREVLEEKAELVKRRGSQRLLGHIRKLEELNPYFYRIFTYSPSLAYKCIKSFKKMSKKAMDYVQKSQRDVELLKNTNKFREQVKKLEKIYRLYLREPSFQEFVSWRVELNNLRVLKGSSNDLEVLKSKAPERVELIPIDGIISGFSRDRILAANVNGRKALIQGKVTLWIKTGKPNIQEQVQGKDLDIPHHEFWKGKFNVILNTQIKLNSYHGGDIRASKKYLFVGPSTLYENVTSGLSLEETYEEFLRISGREKVIFTGRTYHPYLDLDMYFTPIDDRVVLISDLDPCISLLRDRKLLTNEHEVGFNLYQPYFDKVASQFQKNGFDVRRIPMHFWQGHIEADTIQTSFTNEIRDGKNVVVGSSGIEELDSLVREVYNEVGCNVHFIRIADIPLVLQDRFKVQYGESGVRCVVNVLSKD